MSFGSTPGSLKRGRLVFLVAAPGCNAPDTIYGEKLRAALRTGTCQWSSDERSASILVVDDDCEFRRAIAEALASRCYEAIVADTVAEAVAQLGSRRVELVLCDAGGSVQSGLLLAQKCKQSAELAHIPFVVMLDTACQHTWRECLASGADDWVRKSTAMIGEIVARVQSLIENRKRVLSWCVAQLSQLKCARHSGSWTIAGDDLTPVQGQHIARLERIIEERHRDPMFSVEDLAEAMGKSRRSLERLCRLLVDLTPAEIIRCSRLASARRLIEEGHSVKAATAGAGFRDDSDFSRYFREIFGIAARDLKALTGRR